MIGNETNGLLAPGTPGQARPFIMRIHRGQTTENLVDMTIEMHTELTFFSTLMLKAHTTNDWPHDEDDTRVFWREGDDQSPPVQPACEPMQTPNWSQKMTQGEELNNFIVDDFPMVKSTSLVSLRVCEEDWTGDSDWYWASVPVQPSDFVTGPLETADPNNPDPIPFLFCSDEPCVEPDWNYELQVEMRKDKMDAEDAGGDPEDQSCP
jgi:hypothetical protein